MGYRVVRRMLDMGISLAVLVFTIPLMFVIALIIKWDSPGPVLFRHVRLGRFGKGFTLYKFRTMYADARERFPELYAYKYSPEELYSLPIKVLVGKKRDPRELEGAKATDRDFVDDPRVTPIGRWLRKTSLDELPNLINVLKGDMHLVGPRPDIAENVHYYPADHMRKLEVKPGITGLAQTKGRGTLSFMRTNEYDVEYVKHRSLLLDLKILVKTAVVCFGGEGAV